MFPYNWKLSDGYPADNVKQHHKKVFTTFACGGGSSMGYKLAGYDVIGANDIDPQMKRVYMTNHQPRMFFDCPIGELLKIELPQELYDLDVLDGSPPCSTFSMSGSREKAWGKNKMFREGQAMQVLDDLFFDYINLVGKLKPKIFVAENVKGMLAGNAKGYVIEIKKRLTELGYSVQVFMLNGATMGLPQARERVFVVGNRLGLPKLNLNFNEKYIPFKEISDNDDTFENITPTYKKYWEQSKPGSSVGKFFSTKKLNMYKVPGTLTASGATYHPTIKRIINKKESCLIGSFPQDYNFLDLPFRYLIGMSVPPVMMAQISHQIYEQWLKNI